MNNKRSDLRNARALLISYKVGWVIPDNDAERLEDTFMFHTKLGDTMTVREVCELYGSYNGLFSLLSEINCDDAGIHLEILKNKVVLYVNNEPAWYDTYGRVNTLIDAVQVCLLNYFKYI